MIQKFGKYVKGRKKETMSIIQVFDDTNFQQQSVHYSLLYTTKVQKGTGTIVFKLYNEIKLKSIFPIL